GAGRKGSRAGQGARDSVWEAHSAAVTRSLRPAMRDALKIPTRPSPQTSSAQRATRPKAVIQPPIIMGDGDDLMPSPTLPRRRAILFDAGNTLLQMNYRAIADYLVARGHPVSAAQVLDAELRARVRLDGDLASGGSTETRATQERYLRYILLHLGIADEDEARAIAEWRRHYNPPVGLWNLAEPEAQAALGRVKEA